MVGEVLVVRTVASAELRGAVGSRRLSPTARTLPKTARRLPTPATVCHELPRTASFSRRVRRSAFRGNWDLVNGHVAMLLAGLVLGRIDSLKQPETRPVSRDLLLENEAEGIRGPVTVCHINFGDGCARLRKKRRPVGRRFRRGRRPAPNGAEPRSGQREPLADRWEAPAVQSSLRGPKTTTDRRRPTRQRHWATTDDKISSCKWDMAGGRCWSRDGRPVNLINRKTHR